MNSVRVQRKIVFQFKHKSDKKRSRSMSQNALCVFHRDKLVYHFEDDRHVVVNRISLGQMNIKTEC